MTLGVLLSDAIKPTLALGYLICQVLGGILGAAICRVCHINKRLHIQYSCNDDLPKIGPIFVWYRLRVYHEDVQVHFWYLNCFMAYTEQV